MIRNNTYPPNCANVSMQSLTLLQHHNMGKTRSTPLRPKAKKKIVAALSGTPEPKVKPKDDNILSVLNLTPKQKSKPPDKKNDTMPKADSACKKKPEQNIVPVQVIAEVKVHDIPLKFRSIADNNKDHLYNAGK